MTETAEADLDLIGARLVEHIGQRALDMAKALRRSCHGLGDMPLRFPLVPTHEASGVRRRVHGAYLIFYVVDVDQVRILRIIHGAQDYERVMFPTD